MTLEFIAILLSICCLDFLAGMQSSAGIVATLISSRVVNPRLALWMIAVMMGLGPALLGSAVADTFSQDLVETAHINPSVLLAAICGAALWSSFTITTGIPSSTSHAIVGGLLGASVAYGGLDVIKIEGFIKVIIGLFISPFIGMMIGFVVMRGIYVATFRASPRINRFFQRGQMVVSLLLALTSGNNEGQKMVGIMVLGSFMTGYQHSLAGSPGWVLLSSLVLALGALINGNRLLHTIGRRYYQIRPAHALAAQATATGLLFVSIWTGVPVSTTQVFNSSLVGAGSADRISKVRWHVFDRIALTWMLTIPCAGVSAVILLGLLEILG